MAKNKKKQTNNFLSVLKKYALEDFNITENSSPLLKELAKLEIIDPIEEMSWHSTNIKNKLGDPFELINKTVEIDTIDQWDKYINAVMSDVQNKGLDTYKQLVANTSIDLNDTEIKEMASALASMEIKMSAYNEDISLYQQQIQGLKNKNKYKNKDIMGDIEGYKLIEESNRLLNEINTINDQNTKPTINDFDDELNGNADTIFNMGLEDLDSETLANLTDEEIIEWATNNEELNYAKNLRAQARKDLGMDAAPEIETTGKNTEMNTQLNNNFNGGKPNIDASNDDKAIKEKIKRFTEEERKRFEKQSQIDFDKKMKEIEEEFNQEEKRIEKEFGPNKDNFVEPEVETSSGGGGNQEPPKTNTSTDIPDPDDVPKTRSRKQRIEDTGKRLGNDKGPNGSRKRFTGQRVANNSKRSIKKRQLKGKKFKVKGDNLKEVVANTVVSKVVGEATEVVEETVQRLNPNLLNGLDNFADLTDDDIAYFADQISDKKQRKVSIEKWESNRERAKKDRKNKQIIDDFENGKFDYDPENPYGNRIRHNLNEKFAKEVAEETLGSNKVDDVFDWMKKHKIGVLDVGFNLFSSIGDYKDARRKGHGVVSSATRAVGSFAVGEMLGFWGGMGVAAFKLAGTGVVKGTELLYKENRRMNSAANNSVFGAAEFQDTQQLATMRQSGMEMAKMAQYNLQQTLMGNEASFLHR